MYTFYRKTIRAILSFLFPRQPSIPTIKYLSNVCTLYRLPQQHTTSLFSYSDPFVKAGIRTMKRDRFSNWFEVCARMLTQQVRFDIQRNVISTHFVVIPVPASPTRKRKYGFNQCEILCTLLSKALLRPTKNILYMRPAKKQTSLHRHGRFANRSSSFYIPKHKQQYIQNKNILLIDDVTTTGATLIAARDCLLLHGAKSIHCYTIAYTPKTQ